MKSFESFLQLHQNSTPLLIGNIWDVNSAKVFECNGFQAIATSSAAVANAFGYNDGEMLPFELLLQLSKKITQEVNIPFSVDLESGYSRTIPGIIENIKKLIDVGVVGINLEDSLPGHPRMLQFAEHFQKTISAITDYISKSNVKLFLNIRTDGFLLGMPAALNETLSRIKIYENTGANGIFVPCIVNKNDIKQVVQSTRLPLNVMAMTQLPSFTELSELGVKRISMGNAMHQLLVKTLEKNLQTIKAKQSFEDLF
jgi:2-methylisocitrate lyase-like PEP mutase family enzyme